MALKIVATAAAVLGGIGALAAALGASSPKLSADRTCAAPDARIVVDLAKHTLALCDKDKLVEAFSVRLGRGGVGGGSNGWAAW